MLLAVLISLSFNSMFSSWKHVEDSTISTACFAPVLERSVSGVDTVLLSWRDALNLDPDAYEIEWVPSGSAFSGIPDTVVDGSLRQFVIRNLPSGSSLFLQLRAKCSINESSNWAGPYLITTDLTNPSRCGMSIGLAQENCDDPQEIPIHVQNYPGGVLGVTHFVSGISMIIAHTWPEDLTIRLEAPNGKQVLLVEKKGRITDNFGDPGDTTCQNVTRLAPFACSSLGDNSPPFIGAFRPDGDLLELLDGGPVEGTWQLLVCDDLPTDIGTLRYVDIEFQRISCLPVQPGSIDSVTNRSAVLSWEPIWGSCDSVAIEYGVAGFVPGTGLRINLPCDPRQVKIEDLDPSTLYEAYFYQLCDTITSASVCPVRWETACGEATISENADGQDICPDDCGAICQIQGIWSNSTDDNMDWLVYRGATSTTRTGPSQDVSGIGNYFYIETSDALCQRGNTGILESTCLEFGGSVSGCQFSFYYHMYGRDMGTLRLEISTDDGTSWEELWSTSGDQGDVWLQQFVDLTRFAGKLGRLRFVGIGGNGQRSDMAIDELVFYGSVEAIPGSYTFFRDADGDSFGDADVSIFFCSDVAPAGYVANSEDCNDADPAIHPGAMEIPCNLIDENCNGNDDDRQNNTLELNIVSTGDASCEGAEDGFIQVEGANGVPPYGYEWTNGLPDTSFQSMLGAGFYRCTVTDQAGCRTEGPYIEIAESSVLKYAVNRIDRPQCPGLPDGAIYIEVSGGMAPYHFLWSTGDTTKNLSGIPEGEYSVIISDASGCSIETPPIAVLSFDLFRIFLVNSAPPSCHGSEDGFIEVRANGGTPPYRYHWSTGDTSSRISRLGSGSYSCTVTDINGCRVDTRAFVLTDPSPLSVSINGQDMVSCPGGNDGAIRIRVTGGTAPYFYNWSNGTFQQDLFNLSAGQYRVTVTDSKGCTQVGGPYVVSQPSSMTFSIDSLSHVSCPASKDGSISLAFNGGTPPYQYYWSNGTRDTNVISGLDPGSYKVTVTDGFNCKYVSPDFDITLLNIPLELDIRQLDSVKCFGQQSGSAEATVYGGTLPFRYNWSTGVENESDQFQDTLTSLLAGSYRVTVTDGLGCVGSSELIRINQPEQMRHELLKLEDPTCHNDSDGVIELMITGGVPPYEYYWSNGEASKNLMNIKAGSYTVSVTDKNGCLYTTPAFQVDNPEKLGLKANVKGSSGTGMNGEIMIIPFGGKTPYSILWDPRIRMFTAFSATQLTAGTYSVLLEDSVGCQLDTMITVPVINGNSDLLNFIEVKVFPNPVRDQLTLEIMSSSLISVKASLLSTNGTVVKELGNTKFQGEWKSAYDLSNIVPGNYFILLEDVKGRSTSIPLQIY